MRGAMHQNSGRRKRCAGRRRRWSEWGVGCPWRPTAGDGSGRCLDGGGPVGDGEPCGGFTLVELLIVVIVLVLLVSIVLPSLRAARRNARRTVCGCQLREVGRGLDMYAQGHNDWYPTAEMPLRAEPGGWNWWQNAAFLEVLGVEPNPQGRSVLTCPSDREPDRCVGGSAKECWASYAANTSAFGMRRGRSKQGRKRSQVQFPAKALAFCDALGQPDAPHVVGWQGCVAHNFAFRHGPQCTVVHADTHVNWIRRERVPLNGPFLWTEPFWGNVPVFDGECPGF